MKSCAVCLEDKEDVETHTMLPCHCKFDLCVECMESIVACVYHREEPVKIHGTTLATMVELLVEKTSSCRRLQSENQMLLQRMDAWKGACCILFWCMINHHYVIAIVASALWMYHKHPNPRRELELMLK